MYRLLLGSLVALAILPACASPAPAGVKIRVENAWARPAAAVPAMAMSTTPAATAMGSMAASDANSAAYLVILNEGSEADTLVGAAADAATKTEIHETRIEGDVARMMPVARVEVAARGRVELKPAGLHIMLVGLTRELQPGNTIKLVLQFQKAGAIPIDVPVRNELQK